MKLGGNYALARAVKAAGQQPEWCTKWVLPSTSQDEVDQHLENCQALGAKALFNFFYWGDEICLEAVKGTFQPTDYGGQAESVGAYWALVKMLAQRINISGQQAVVSIEQEWNKLGPHLPVGKTSITAEPAVWDKIFADTAGTIRNIAPNAKVLSAPGSWHKASNLYQDFPRVLRASDMLGTQLLRCVTRDSTTSYDKAPDLLLEYMTDLQQVASGKPLILADMGLSSYGAAFDLRPPFSPVPWAIAEQARQARVLERMNLLRPKLDATGLQGIVYRALRDDAMFNVANWYGYGERSWGLQQADGTPKPAWTAFLRLAN